MIFVLGTGRCGTSTVARLLHENNIACMGHRFDQPNKFNPEGFWEDLDVREQCLLDLFTGHVGDFRHSLKRLHHSNGCKHSMLGYKHPSLCSVERSVWNLLNPKAIFWCTRPEEETIESMVRYREFNRGRGDYNAAYRLYHNRMTELEENIQGLSFVAKIDFSKYRTDEWLLNRIRSSL